MVEIVYLTFEQGYPPSPLLNPGGRGIMLINRGFDSSNMFINGGNFLPNLWDKDTTLSFFSSLGV